MRRERPTSERNACCQRGALKKKGGNAAYRAYEERSIRRNEIVRMLLEPGAPEKVGRGGQDALVFDLHHVFSASRREQLAKAACNGYLLTDAPVGKLGGPSVSMNKQ